MRMDDAVAERARALIATRRFPDAIRLLGPHVAVHPEDTDACRMLGWAQLGADDLDGALRSLRRLATTAPDAVDTHLLAAAVHSSRHEYADARTAAQNAIRLRPDHPAPYRTAVAIDIDAGMATDTTVALARKAIELDPQDVDAHRLAGTALLNMRRRKEAGEYLRKAVALDPDNTTTAAELSRWQASTGRSAAAARGFAAVVRADPTDVVALHNLRVTVWRTFSIAQLVLWIAMVVLGRVRLLTSGDPASWIRGIGPVVVVLTLAAWGFQLRGAWRGVGTMLTVLRSDRLLQLGLAAHVLCLVALLGASLLGGTPGEVSLIVGVALLLLASGTTWVRRRQVNREKEPGGGDRWV